MSPSPPRPIVITPYFKEARFLLARCIASVKAQSVPCDHMLVADGHPQSWLDDAEVRHLRLDRAHGDYGNTPRGVAAVLAAAENYPAIGMLDADNWLEPNHVEVCLDAARRAPNGICDFVVARSTLRRPDGSPIDVNQQPASEHVDTSCFFFLPGSYHVLAAWALMPRQLSPLGDRIFWSALKSRGLSGVVHDRATVNYHCIWESVYQAIGETPPADAKPNIDPAAARSWIASLSDRELEIASRWIGARLNRP